LQKNNEATEGENRRISYAEDILPAKTGKLEVDRLAELVRSLEAKRSNDNTKTTETITAVKVENIKTIEETAKVEKPVEVINPYKIAENFSSEDLEELRTYGLLTLADSLQTIQNIAKARESILTTQKVTAESVEKIKTEMERVERAITALTSTKDEAILEILKALETKLTTLSEEKDLIPKRISSEANAARSTLDLDEQRLENAGGMNGVKNGTKILNSLKKIENKYPITEEVRILLKTIGKENLREMLKMENLNTKDFISVLQSKEPVEKVPIAADDNGENSEVDPWAQNAA
jgi:hypothetical protein